MTDSPTIAAQRELCLWVTPKIFPRLDAPGERVAEFFDHYAAWVGPGDRLVLNVCTGNGDHVLNYRGAASWSDNFDWARYNSYAGPGTTHHSHNLDWIARVREGGERSFNPYNAGPMVVISEESMTYHLLDGIYRAFRDEAERRGIDLVLLEYLEPGPEFCRSTWKTELHPEGARGTADAGGNIATGVIDVTSTLHADSRPYAAYPAGIPDGEVTGDFVAAQTAAFVDDFGLDGVFLGNQFGLLGFWHPDAAPEPTPERRAGITRFFHAMRAALGEHLVYWMDTYWPADVEESAWAMHPGNYYLLDAVMVSNFAVLVERTQIEPNLRSRLALRDPATTERLGGGRPAPRILFSFDFVDPWYWYRVHLDDRRTYLYQHESYARIGHEADGVTYFANDTFGHFVWPAALTETRDAVASALATRTRRPR